jgi:hypothetical protein
VITYLGITSASELYETSQILPGSVLNENNIDPSRSAVSVDPPLVNPYYVFLIDDGPGQKNEHPYRYAWADCAGNIGVVSAAMPMTIQPIWGSPTPFTTQGTTTVDNISLNYGYGDFGAVPADNNSYPPIEVSPEDPVDGAPEYFSDLSGGNALPCLREAVIIDGGDEKANFFNRDSASAAHADADLMNGYLTGKLFTIDWQTQDYHQDGSNKLSVGSGRASASVLAMIANMGLDFDNINKKNPNLNCRHEAFFYFSGHADRDGHIAIYSSNGDGTSESILYSDIIGAMNKYPANTTVYLMIDGCYSGTLITKGSPNDLMANPRLPSKLPPLVGVYVITSSSETQTSVAGHLVIDSGTEDFNQGLTGSDLDGDSRTNDIGDGFLQMVNDGYRQTPQRLRNPDQNDQKFFILE